MLATCSVHRKLNGTRKEERRGHTGDVDRVAKVISGLDNMMSDDQDNEAEKYW